MARLESKALKAAPQRPAAAIKLVHVDALFHGFYGGAGPTQHREFKTIILQISAGRPPKILFSLLAMISSQKLAFIEPPADISCAG
jgi:hypothetical protein